MKQKVIIYGAGSQGLIIAEILSFYDEYQLEGFLDDSKATIEKEIQGKPVIGGWNQMETCLKNGIGNLVVGIGDNKMRVRIAGDATSLGYSLINAIHPTASIASGLNIGPGTVIKALAVLEPGSVIDENVIIGANSYIGHETMIGNGVHVSGGCKIGGKTVVGEQATIGIGATIINNIHIGKNAQVGAGAVVLEDVPDNQVVFGVPARPIWDRNFWADETG